MTFVSPWPSPCRNTDVGPYSSTHRLISSAQICAASSQPMRSYPLIPRVSGWRSPWGSQSTRLSGYGTRFLEYTRFL